IKGDVPDVCLLVAGQDVDRSYSRTICERARRHGLGERVWVIDNFPEFLKTTLLAAADIIALPVDSVQETFGIAVLEAMAHGKPVADAYFACRTHQYFPQTVFKLAQQKDFHLRFGFIFGAHQARGKNFGLVEYETIIRPKIVDNIGENALFNRLLLTVQDHELGFLALLFRILRNELLGYVDFEI
ncbi:glycosyltransferase, partial [candidate division KSB1 bacterium]|nr:glycosyltransferase [candidate division KSB1 bacterium]